MCKIGVECVEFMLIFQKFNALNANLTILRFSALTPRPGRVIKTGCKISMLNAKSKCSDQTAEQNEKQKEHTNTHTHTHTHAQLHTRTHTYTNTHTHTYIHNVSRKTVDFFLF